VARWTLPGLKQSVDRGANRKGAQQREKFEDPKTSSAPVDAAKSLCRGMLLAENACEFSCVMRDSPCKRV